MKTVASITRWEQALGLLSAETQRCVRRDEPMRRHTSLRVGGPADYYLEAKTPDTLAEAAALAQRLHLPCFMLGEGSNLCVSDRGIRGMVLRNACRHATIGPESYADAGHNFMQLFQKALWAGLSGLEFAVGIPGTLGGALVSNAGAYRANICDLVRRIDLVHAGIRQCVGPEWMGFSYRDSRLRREPHGTTLLVGVWLGLTPAAKPEIQARAAEFQLQRIGKQPWESSAGSFFKNVYDRALAESLPNLPTAMKEAGVVPAAYLSEACGCKGLTVGDAAVSPQHANFVVNRGLATAWQIRQAAETVKARVLERFGILLEEEVLYVGDWDFLTAK